MVVAAANLRHHYAAGGVGDNTRAASHRVVREYNITTAVWIKPVSIRAAQRRVYAAVSDGDASTRPWVQRPKWRVAERDIGQEQVTAAPQLEQVTAGVAELLHRVRSTHSARNTHT